jgi:alkyl hydroperoxide reductase subunit AhpF
MTAAVYASRKGLRCLVLGKDVGGQLNITAELENHPGFHYIEAQSLVGKFDEHVKQFEMDRIIGENVVRLEALPKIKRVCTQTALFLGVVLVRCRAFGRGLYWRVYSVFRSPSGGVFRSDSFREWGGAWPTVSSAI